MAAPKSGGKAGAPAPAKPKAPPKPKAPAGETPEAPAEKKKGGPSSPLAMSWTAVGSVIGGYFTMRGIQFIFPPVDELAKKVDPTGKSNAVIVPLPTALAEAGAEGYPKVRVLKDKCPDLELWPEDDYRNRELWWAYQAENPPYAVLMAGQKAWDKTINLPKRKK